MPIIRYLSEHGVDMADAETDIESHPDNRRYHVSCILATLIRFGDEACEKFTGSFAYTGHGFVEEEWDKWRKSKKLKLTISRL